MLATRRSAGVELRDEWDESIARGARNKNKTSNESLELIEYVSKSPKQQKKRPCMKNAKPVNIRQVKKAEKKQSIPFNKPHFSWCEQSWTDFRQIDSPVCTSRWHHSGALILSVHYPHGQPPLPDSLSSSNEI